MIGVTDLRWRSAGRVRVCSGVRLSVHGERSFLRRGLLVLLLGLSLLSGAAAAVAQGGDETAADLQFLEELERELRRGGSWSMQRDLSDYLVDHPESPRARALAASAAMQRGRLDEADEHMAASPDPDLRMRAALLTRRGSFDELLALAADPGLSVVTAAWLRVTAMNGAGQRLEARTEAENAIRELDDRALTGLQMMDLGRMLLFLRRLDGANQAFVFADADLNGKRGPSYRLEHPEVLVMLARIFHEARQSGGAEQALSLLDDVFEVDPGAVEALVVAAREYIYGFQSHKAQAALERALTRDPDHPEALFVRGRMRLLARRVDDALADAELILSTNGRHHDGLALKAAALSVAARAGAPAAREAFVRSHPQSAGLDALEGEVLQAFYRFDDSIAPLERALQREPYDERPLPILAQSLAHVGRESEARAALEEHHRRSPYPYPWRANMVAVLRSLEDSVSVRTPGGFHLRLPVGEQDVTGVLMAEALETARADMGERWGVLPEGEVLVEVFDHHADFSVRTIGFSGFGALGACFGKVFTTLSPLCELRGGGAFHWRQTLVHEYAHTVTLALSRNRIPRWLTEGISVVEEARVDPTWRREIERDVLDARANGLIVPVTRMDELFRDGTTIGLGYYLGSLVCEVIEDEFGFAALRDLVAAYGEDLSTADAVRRALGVEPAELHERLLDHIETHIASRAKVRPRYRPAGKDRLRERVSGGDREALLPLALAYLDHGQVVDAEASLERYLRRGEDGPKVDRVRAELALAQGDRAAARQWLEAWAEHADSELLEADGLVLLARLTLESGERELAADWLRKARPLFPTDVSHVGATPMLLGLLDSEEDAEEVEQLLRALVEVDGQAFEPRLKLARKAEERGDSSEARRWYGQLVDIDPYRPDLRMALADLAESAGDVDAALRQWRLVLGMRPEQVILDDQGKQTVGPGDLLGHLQGMMGGPGSALEDIQERARTRIRAAGGAAPRSDAAPGDPGASDGDGEATANDG